MPIVLTKLVLFIFANSLVWVIPGFVLTSKLGLARKYTPHHFIVSIISSCAISSFWLFFVGSFYKWSASSIIIAQIILTGIIYIFPQSKTKSIRLGNWNLTRKNKYCFAALTILLAAACALPYFELHTKNDFIQCVIGDWDGREGVIWSICNHGLPLKDPFFYPGQTLRMYYPVVFYILPAAVATISGTGITFGWIVSIILVSICLYYLAVNLSYRLSGKTNYVWIFVFMFLIGGFDWIVVGIKTCYSRFFEDNLYLVRHVDAWAAASVMRVDNIYAAAIWAVPHLCAVMLFLTLMTITPLTTRRLPRAIFGGILLAAIFGFSPYVFIGAILVVSWNLIPVSIRTVKRKSARFLNGHLIAFAVMITLLIPYMLDLNKADLSSGKPKLSFCIPKTWPSIFCSTYDCIVSRLLDVSVYYFLELAPLLIPASAGVYLIIRNRKLCYRYKYLISAVLICSALPAFIRSTGTYNDFGMRVILIAQIGFAFFAAYFATNIKCFRKKVIIPVAAIALLGLLSPLYELGCVGLSRFVVKQPSDRFEYYCACEFINQNTPADAIIAVDPQCHKPEMARRLMGRQIMIGSILPGSLAYTDKSLLEKTMQLNKVLFTNGSNPECIRKVSQHGVSYILNKTDAGIFETFNNCEQIFKNNHYQVLKINKP